MKSQVSLKGKLVTLVALLAVAITIYQCSGPEEPGPVIPNDENQTITLPPPHPGGVYDPPSIRTYPSTSPVIYGWIADYDFESIRAHSWDIWEAITYPTPEGVPVWETWYSGYELFNLAPEGQDLHERNLVKDFEYPKQFLHVGNTTPIPSAPAERQTAFNRFSYVLAHYINDQGYNKKSVMTQINQDFINNNTPIAQREIQTTPDTNDVNAFALKPVFQFISGTEPTAIPYWAGVSPQSSTNLTNPEPYTWRQCVVVDPTGTLKPGSTYKTKCNCEEGEWPVVSIDEFYSLQLTQAMADSFSAFGLTSGDDLGASINASPDSIKIELKPGNYAILMAMHVTGKEINNWTWQTFWWNPNSSQSYWGHDHPSTLQKPWSNYDMKTAYFMVMPAGQKKGAVPHHAYNPYLETNLYGTVPILNDNCQPISCGVNRTQFTCDGHSKTDSCSDCSNTAWYGVFTNCMSCHRGAEFGGPQIYYPDGYIDKADPCKFDSATKTDFLWSIPTRVQ